MSDAVAAAEPNPWLIRLGLLIAFIAVNGPLLAWTEFHNPEESVNVATAMELLRDGHWKVPTLDGVPRLVKPPLASWVTAAAIPRSTLAALDRPNRQAAYRELTWWARVPSMICAAMIVIGVYEIGRALAGWKVALCCAACAFTNFLVLAHASLDTTDVHLAAWVTLANAFMAHAVLRKNPRAWLGAGVALGLAIMSKGPLALLQSVAPLAVFLIWRRERNLPWRMIGVAAILMVVLGGWWYAWVGATTPGIWELWLHEVSRYHANVLPANDWWRYFASFWFFFPWVVLILIGIGQGPFVMWWRNGDVVVLPWLLLVVPLVVMCFFHERKERYLLPMTAPAAIIAGKVLMDLIDGVRRGDIKCDWLLYIQWMLTAALSVGLPVLGTTTRFEDLLTENGGPVFARSFGYTVAAMLFCITLIAFIIRRRFPLSILIAGVVVFLANYVIYVKANSVSPGGQCGMRPTAERIHNHAAAEANYYTFHASHNFAAIMADSADLAIYTNRTIHWVDDPNLVAGSLPRVFFTIQGKSEKRPQPPRGSRLVFKVYRRGSWEFFFETRLTPTSTDLK